MTFLLGVGEKIGGVKQVRPMLVLADISLISGPDLADKHYRFIVAA